MDVTAILFVPLIAGTWVFGLALLSYISHIFLTIVEETGNGVDQHVAFEYRSFKSYIHDGFNWTEDVYTDWFLKLIYLAYIVGIWFAPSVMIGRAVSDDPAVRTLVSTGLFWLSFPLGVASSLASASRWTPFWPPLLRLMFHRPLGTLGFYLLSAPLVAVMGTTLSLMFGGKSTVAFMWVLALSPVATGAFFLYCRLLGRFAFVLNCVRGELYQEPEPEPEPKPKKRKRKAESNPLTQWASPTAAHDQHPVNAQPEDLPPIHTPDEGDVTGYNVDFSGAPAKQEEPAPRRTVHRFDGEEDASPFAVNAADDRPEPTADRARLREKIAQPNEREIALYTRHRPVERTLPYGLDVVTRMLNTKTVAVGMMMAMGLAVLATLQHALDALRPG